MRDWVYIRSCWRYWMNIHLCWRYWVNIRFFGCCRWRFRSYSESPFPNAGVPAQRKGNPKGFAPAYGTSLRLSVPSLRCPSGGIAYGLLRCTSSRCMRLRRMALRAFPLMDTSARPAEGAKNQKPSQDQKPEPDQKIAAFGSSYMGLGVFSG